MQRDKQFLLTKLGFYGGLFLVITLKSIAPTKASRALEADDTIIYAFAHSRTFVLAHVCGVCARVWIAFRLHLAERVVAR